MSRGENALDRLFGGGAGGSIWIEARSLQGDGVVSVTGGSGGSQGGGGSGGMLAMYYTTSLLLFKVNIHGGTGGVAGASGMAYFKRDDQTLGKLLLDNNDQEAGSSALICQPSKIDLFFSEIEIRRRAKLVMISCSGDQPMSMIVNKLTGDRTGLLEVESSQDVYFSVLPSGRSSPVELMSSVFVKFYGLLSLPESVVLSKGVELRVEGNLVGVKELTVSSGAKLSVRSPGGTGRRQNTSLFEFDTLYVQRSGIVKNVTTNNVKFNLKLLKLDYGSRYAISENLTSYENKIVQASGTPLKSITCPHGVVTFVSPSLHNTCGEGIAILTIPYQVERNVSQGGTYRLVNVTNYNISCDYTDFRLLPGQNCRLKPGRYKYRSLEIHSKATMNFEADARRVVTNVLEVEKLRVFADGMLRGLSGHWTSNSLARTAGGTHGGSGGRNNYDNVYGNVRSPESYGSSGGGLLQDRGEGGGQLMIRVAQEFVNDGLVQVSGGDGNRSGGGGSGGSLLVRAKELKGCGVFQANGGKTSANDGGGGGGGGRISLYLSSSIERFHGRYEVYGGNGYQRGTSGTIFVKDGGNKVGSLIIKGHGAKPVVLPLNTSVSQIDSLHILESSTFQVSVPRLVVDMLHTDGQGKIVIPGGNGLEINGLPLGRIVGCDLDVRGTLTLKDPVILNGPGVALRADGLVRTPAIIVGRNKTVRWVNGELETNSLNLRPFATLNIVELIKVHVDEIYVGANAKLIVEKEHVSLKSKRFTFDAYSMLYSTSPTKSVNITADNVHINSFASLDVTAGGYLQGPGFDGQAGIGGSHGGQAGRTAQNHVYGSLFAPFEFGSGSLDTSRTPQRGGGRLVMNVADVLILDGEMRADGEGSSREGGGSGGSVMITAKVLRGSGVVRSNGKQGGSGGRIALYVNDRREFSGAMNCYGGCGNYCGAAGSIFIKEYLVGIAYNTTVVSNAGRQSSGLTSIMHGTISDYTLGKLRVVEGGRVQVVNPNVTKYVKIKVLELEGDFSGELRVNRNQKLSLGASSAAGRQPFVLRCAVSVEEGAELVLAPRVFVKGTLLSPSLHVAGKVRGSQELIVGRDALVTVSPAGVIGTKSSQKGTLTFRSLNVLSGGRIAFNLGGKTKMEVSAVLINIDYNGVVESSYVVIKTPSLIVRMGASIRADGLGYGPSKGPGRGSSLNSLFYGGSYGGCGGGHVSQSCPIYGSLFGSVELGSGGGSDGRGTGGSGGGVIVLEVGSLRLDGVISSDGGNGDEEGGGGSGGSIHVTIRKEIRGRGVMQARGGKAARRGGGGGGGGRVYLDAQGIYQFRGTFKARGGAGLNKPSGSPGTIWLVEYKNGLPTKRLIIDNKDTSTNRNLPVVLKESLVTKYTIDLLRLMGNVTLIPDHHMTIRRLVSSPRSTISVSNGLVLEVETDLTLTSPACSFHVATNGEIRLPSSVTFLGPDNRFSGTITGVLDMIIGEGRSTQLSTSARTALFVDGNYTFISKRGEYKFASLLVKSNAVLSFENSGQKKIPLVFGALELRYGSVLRGSWLDIQAVNIFVRTGASIDLAGQGYTGGNGTGRGGFEQGYASGAGYGGVGGGVSTSGGRWYGDMVVPSAFGSGGGSGDDGGGGSGGGHLHIVTSGNLTVDGMLLVSGSDCVSITCAGGSGGTVSIQSRSLTGVGVITSRGGDGNETSGGGGSGGRIAIHLSRKMLFEGAFEVQGGDGSYLGASGTVYVEEEKDRIPRKKVTVSNKGREESNGKPLTALASNIVGTLRLDEVELIGPSSVSFFNMKTQKLKIVVAKLSADNKGEIVIRSNQTMYTETSEARETSLTLRTNIVIKKDAALVAASELFIDGAFLRVAGRLLNVRDLTLESGSTASFEETSQTGLLEGGTKFASLTQPGTQQFGSLVLKSGSSFVAPQNLRINVAKMVVKNGVVITVKDLKIAASTVVFERGTTVSADAVSTSGLGTGTSASGTGSGGSHASSGGTPEGRSAVGKAYGSLYRPKDPGSPGGEGSSLRSAGKGGGVIEIFASSMRVDGRITANGGRGALGSNAGGGSGGSILLSIGELLGKGDITVDGGLGDGGGGCGSGGRITVLLKRENAFRGTMGAASGACATSLAAGPGTVFIEEVKNKRQYKRLVIDNRDRNWDTFVTLDEKLARYDFNEVVLRGGAAIQLLKLPQTHQTLRIELLTGDRSGLVRVHSNQTVILGDKTLSRVPASIKVDEGGLMIIPQNFVVVGRRSYSIESRGTILGMRNIDVARGRAIRFYATAVLGIGTSRKDHSGSKGTFEFGSLTLQSNSSMIIDDTDTVKIIAGSIDLKFNATLISSLLSLTVSRLHVEVGGRIDCSGGNAVIWTKSGTSHLTSGTGAGHGSNGGAGNDGQRGNYYGSLYVPTERGRNGGGGLRGGDGGRGGGSLLITVGTRFIVDGIITVAGGNAPAGSDAGGGSGGSVYVTTNSFRGYGKIRVRGGNAGGSRAGSGAGGRIAIYTKTRALYRGTYEASGGSGKAGKHGGPGTVYLEDLRYKKSYMELRFGHREGESLAFVTLDEKNTTRYVFSEVIIEQRTAVRLKQDGVQRSLRVARLSGDGTGFVQVGLNQTFYLQGSTGEGGVTRPPVNLDIATKGTVLVDSSLFVVSDGVSSPNGNALTMNGRIIGMQHLFVTKSRKMVFGAQAETANYVNSTLQVSSPGSFVLATVEVQDRARLMFLTSSGMKGLVGKIHVKYGAVIVADTFNLGK